MKILVIGSGGREHALVWKIAQSPKVKKIYCAPGNAGICKMAECVEISVSDLNGLVKFAKDKNIDLTVVGPELPLVLGITDLFIQNNLKVFGPSKECSLFEGSKAFTKKFLNRCNIPTAAYEEYTNLEKAIKGLNKFSIPVVIKADGLAAGKGVIIAQSKDEAKKALEDMMVSKNFGEAGEKVVIEEFLTGVEASVLCFVDGKTIVPMESARDYKRIFDNDLGGNTGGMGTYSPNKIFNKNLKEKIKEIVLEPIIKGFQEDNLDFRGILFIGLMIEEGEPKVLEFNVRFGDPETQSILMRLDTDIVEIFESVIEGNLIEQQISWNNQKSVCVVLASGGYPDSYKNGKEITGLDAIENAVVFHAGTKMEEGSIVSNGGRVLGVTATADTIEKAKIKVYNEVKKIHFAGMQYRKDIAH